MAGWNVWCVSVRFVRVGRHTLSVRWRTCVGIPFGMEARPIPVVPTRLQEAVDALVAESIETFSTETLSADLVDMRRAIDRLEAEFLRRLHRFHSERGAQSDG